MIIIRYLLQVMLLLTVLPLRQIMCILMKGLSGEELESKSVSELQKHEDSVMKENVRYIMKDVRSRIDDQPGPGGSFMQTYVTPETGKIFKVILQPRSIKILQANFLLKRFQGLATD